MGALDVPRFALGVDPDDQGAAVRDAGDHAARMVAAHDAGAVFGQWLGTFGEHGAERDAQLCERHFLRPAAGPAGARRRAEPVRIASARQAPGDRLGPQRSGLPSAPGSARSGHLSGGKPALVRALRPLPALGCAGGDRAADPRGHGRLRDIDLDDEAGTAESNRPAARNINRRKQWRKTTRGKTGSSAASPTSLRARTTRAMPRPLDRPSIRRRMYTAPASCRRWSSRATACSFATRTASSATRPARPRFANCSNAGASGGARKAAIPWGARTPRSCRRACSMRHSKTKPPPRQPTCCMAPSKNSPRNWPG
ncbi:hypothetical protein VARIO8X_90741 [Burkholderiales bacterium 8X]|nr:hypothetical protein VARIO8X_90741 [Burkholderiales bacterium 8X]